MASSKDMFEAHFFRANYFAAGMWRGAESQIQSVPGAEYRLSADRLHFVIGSNRTHLAANNDRLHFSGGEE